MIDPRDLEHDDDDDDDDELIDEMLANAAFASVMFVAVNKLLSRRPWFAVLGPAPSLN